MPPVTKLMILVVDDNKDILFNLRIQLESKGYEVETALNGKNALNVLSKLKNPPDLIISDIMMPQMDGYEFFSTVSNNPQWSRIPFLFLTAKSTPEDIRFGKMLGIDDYITKPFNNEDLFATIAGKIARHKKSNLIDNEIKKLLSSLNIKTQPSIPAGDHTSTCLFLVYWDDVLGPIIKTHYPSDKDVSFSLRSIGVQLFQAVISIYGHTKITRAQGFLLNIENINQKGYIFFDSYPDETERHGEKQYMISVISPNITYFDSLEIKLILKEISEKIKNKQDWEIKEYWEKVISILSKDLLLLNTQNSSTSNKNI
ncbi:MAG: response regulator [Promethearchaeota archaeon]